MPMKRRFWIPGLILVSLGAVGAFTLKGTDHSIENLVRVQPLGLVLLGLGTLFLLAGGVEWCVTTARPGGSGSGPSVRAQSIQSIGGFISGGLGVGSVADSLFVFVI